MRGWSFASMGSVLLLRRAVFSFAVKDTLLRFPQLHPMLGASFVHLRPGRDLRHTLPGRRCRSEPPPFASVRPSAASLLIASDTGRAASWGHSRSTILLLRGVVTLLEVPGGGATRGLAP